MTTKLQFEFVLMASPKDSKSNTIAITSITTEDGEQYALPEEDKFIDSHKEIMKTENYNKVKSSLKKRHQIRKVWITLSQALRDTYIDADGNLQFMNKYLEEITEEKGQNNNLSKILEKLVETTQNKEGRQNLKHISEKFIIEKFNSKNSNATQWMENFEKECARFDISKDETKIEILRLFLEKGCLDWYSSTITKLTVDSAWDEWKKRFLETFANKGWKMITYALSFKYREGTLIDYAMKKEKLLLDMNKNIDTETLIALITVGLPEFIMNKIDKDKIEDSTDLFNEIRKHENLVSKNFPKRREDGSEYKKNNIGKKPCKICESLNKGFRYHPEDSCWFKMKENDKEKNKKSSVVGNNSIIEVELNTEKKN